MYIKAILHFYIIIIYSCPYYVHNYSPIVKLFIHWSLFFN